MSRYAIEMFEVDGNWSVQSWGNRKKPAPLNRTAYEWNPTGKGRWVLVGGRFDSVEEAEAKIEEYRRCGSWQKPKEFRVVFL